MDRTWKAMGVVTLALAVSVSFGWAVGAGSGRPSEVSAYGGGTTGLIAFPVGNDRVYLIDPEAKVILVYAKAAKYATSLIGGRSYDLDIELVKRTEIELRQNGMPLQVVRQFVNQRLAGGGWKD